MTDVGKPLPVVDADSRPYWQAAREHRLVLPRCDACGRWVFYPRRICPYCGGTALTWRSVGGHGTIYSYTVSRRPISPAYADDVPYVIVLVDLDEGPRMMANLVGSGADDVRIGQRVAVTFEDLTAEVTLPQFRLA